MPGAGSVSVRVDLLPDSAQPVRLLAVVRCAVMLLVALLWLNLFAPGPR